MNKRNLSTLLISSLSFFLLCATAGAQEEHDSYQANMLNKPSERQLQKEARGMVFIYDGLTDKEVDRAMSTKWKRINAMMFVNTKLTDTNGQLLLDPETGEVLTEDDDCDD